jgi:pilus assembly protein CpaD
VPSGNIVIAAYQAGPEERAAPVRLSFSAMRAHTDRCGRWPDDVLNNAENKHYANFGCAYQNNLAAQIANPSDLLGPRKMTEMNAVRRTNSITDYENRATDWSEPPSSEVGY